MLENQKSKVAGDATMIKNNNACSCGCCSAGFSSNQGICPVCNNKGEAVGKYTKKF
jgi:predicted amidophosphoribosyltransferase